MLPTAKDIANITATAIADITASSQTVGNGHFYDPVSIKSAVFWSKFLFKFLDI